MSTAHRGIDSLSDLRPQPAVVLLLPCMHLHIVHRGLTPFDPSIDLPFKSNNSSCTVVPFIALFMIMTACDRRMAVDHACRPGFARQVSLSIVHRDVLQHFWRQAVIIVQEHAASP